MHSGSWEYVKLIKLRVHEDLILKSIKISTNVIIFTSFHSFGSPLILALMVNVVALKNTNNRPAYLWWSSALMKREVLLVESHGTVPKNGNVAVIGSIREMNVVPMWTAVPFCGALLDIPKDGCEGDYRKSRHVASQSVIYKAETTLSETS